MNTPIRGSSQANTRGRLRGAGLTTFPVAPAARAGGLFCWIALMGKEFVRLFLTSKTVFLKTRTVSRPCGLSAGQRQGSRFKKDASSHVRLTGHSARLLLAGGGPTTGCGRAGLESPRGARVMDPMTARWFMPCGRWVRKRDGLGVARHGGPNTGTGLPPTGVGLRRSELESPRAARVRIPTRPYSGGAGVDHMCPGHLGAFPEGWLRRDPQDRGVS